MYMRTKVCAPVNERDCPSGQVLEVFKVRERSAVWKELFCLGVTHKQSGKGKAKSHNQVSRLVFTPAWTQLTLPWLRTGLFGIGSPFNCSWEPINCLSSFRLPCVTPLVRALIPLPFLLAFAYNFLSRF